MKRNKKPIQSDSDSEFASNETCKDKLSRSENMRLVQSKIAPDKIRENVLKATAAAKAARERKRVEVNFAEINSCPELLDKIVDLENTISVLLKKINELEQLQKENANQAKRIAELESQLNTKPKTKPPKRAAEQTLLIEEPQQKRPPIWNEIKHHQSIIEAIKTVEKICGEKHLPIKSDTEWEAEYGECKNYYAANGRQIKNWTAAITKWFLNSVKYAKEGGGKKFERYKSEAELSRESLNRSSVERDNREEQEGRQKQAMLDSLTKEAKEEFLQVESEINSILDALDKIELEEDAKAARARGIY